MLLSFTLQNVLKKAIEGLYGVQDAVVEVVVQENPKFGEYSSSVPLGLGKRLGKKPQDVGKEIIEALQGDKDLKDMIDRVELAGTGFLNFYLRQRFIAGELKKIFDRGFEYENIGKGKKLQLEFISANPTGPLTLANGRAGFFGDVLTCVFQKCGFVVEKEYYVNDAGNQIEKLGTSVSVAAGLFQSVEGDELYKGDYIGELARSFGDVRLMGSRDSHELLGRKIVEKRLLGSIKSSLESIGIHFDRFTSEQRDIREKKYSERFMELAKEKGLVYEQDGAVWLKTREFGDDKDRVLITSDRQLTYLAADAGHYLETVEREFRVKINVLGADHHGYIGRIQAVAKILGLEQSEIIIMQLVKLVKDGKEFRMSKRKGTYVTIDEVVEELGPDVTRYFFLTRAPSSQLTIDLDLAKKESKENPVYYIQYAGARISGILGKVSALKRDDFDFVEIAEEEIGSVKKILFWNEEVYRACNDRLVHPLAKYAYELADSFHTFYEKYRVIESDAVNPSRLALVLLYRKAFLEVFQVLGVKFLEKM